MPVTFSPSALSEARRRLYGANAGQSTSRATQLARIERDAYEQQARANKAAADAEQKAIEDAAKQADDERKLANAQRTNELLAQGRRYHLDRVTGEPRPLQSDEEFAAAKAEKGRKLQEAEAKKKEEARQKTELDKVTADEAVLRENEKSIQRNQQREELEREEKRRKLKGIQEEYEKRLKAADDLELDLTPEQRQATVGTIENVKKRLADLDTAKFEKQKESLKFDTAQDEREALLRKREAAIKRGEAPTPSLEPLIADPVEFEQSAAQHEQEVQQFNAEQAQQQAKFDALEAENERLMSLPHSAADVSTDGKWHKDVIPQINALNQAMQSRSPEWQAKQQRIQEQAKVLNESATAINAQAKAANEQAKAEQAAAREAAYQDFEKVAPGMGKEYQAILDDNDKRAAALRTRFAGREDAPEAKAAFMALEADITGKLDGLRGKIETTQKAKSDNLEKLWNQFGAGDFGTATMRDWVADKSTDPEYDKLGGVSSMPANFKAKVKEMGLDEKEARNYMETRRQLDWSSPLDPEKAEKSAELTRPLREKLGITDMLEPVRRLPNGAIIPNPVLGGDEEAFKKVIEAADGTPEQKAEAMKLWPSYRRQYGEGLLTAFAKQSAFGTDFNEWRDHLIEEDQKVGGKNGFAAMDAVDQALMYQEQMKGRSFFRRWADLIASNVTAGFMDVTQAVLGTTAALTGNIPVAGEGWSKLAAANAENAASLVNTQEQLSNTGLAGSIAGTIARMAPGVAATVATGSMAGGMIFGGAQTAGSLYGEAYNTLRNEGKSHMEAWKASAPASLAAGAMTAGLTKLFPGGVTALANNPEARASVRAMVAGFMSSGKAITKGALDEIPEEVIDEAMSQLAQGYAEGRNPDDVVRDFITGLPELVVASGLMGGGMQALKDRMDRRAGGLPPDIAPEAPEAPEATNPYAGPLPEERAAVQAAIAAFNPTAPESIQAMPAVIRTVPKGQESGINAKARAAMDAVAGIASGEITDSASLTETQMRALGVKLDKNRKLVPAGGANSPAPLIYTRTNKAGVDQIIITDEARDWLKGALPDLTIGQSEAERIQAINRPKPKPKPKQEMSGTRLRKLAQNRQNELTWKRDGKAGDAKTIATISRQLSKDEEAELEFLDKHLADNNTQAIADKYGVKLKSATTIISEPEAAATPAATPADPSEIHRKRNAERKSYIVRDADGDIDRQATKEKREAAAKAAGMTRDAWEDMQAALNVKANEDFFKALNKGDTVEWVDGNGNARTGRVEIQLDGSKVVRDTTEGNVAQDYLYTNLSGEFSMHADSLKVTPKQAKQPAPAPETAPKVQSGPSASEGAVEGASPDRQAKVAPTPGAAKAVATRPALGKAPPLQRKAIGKGAGGQASYAEFATVDDADAFAYAAKIKKSQTDKGSMADAEAAKDIITRLAAKMKIGPGVLRTILVNYNEAVRTQAKAVREGESFYAPTLAEFMQASQPQTDTKADISAAEIAPTVGETAPAEVDTEAPKGRELIGQAHARMAAIVQSASAPDKPKATAAAKAIIDGLRRYNGHLPIVLTDDPAFDFAWGRREQALIINPETALARFVGDSTDADNAAAQARQFFRHELIHKFVVSQLGDARVMDIWQQLPAEVQDQVQKAYSVRLVARGQKPKKLNPDHGGHEYYRAMLEAMKDGTMTEQVIGKDLTDKWRKFLDDVLALLRDLRKQFASIKSESARNELIAQVDQDIKLVSDAIDAFEKSISPDAEPAQTQNAGAGSTSGKPVEGSSTTVANPVSRKREKKSSAKKEPESPEPPKQGEVGMKLAAGEVVLTATGRRTTPFPRLDMETERKTGSTLKRVDAWLYENAVAEAKARNDDFNLRSFEAENPAKMPPATKDGMELYLFDPEFAAVTTQKQAPEVAKPTAEAPKTQELQADYDLYASRWVEADKQNAIGLPPDLASDASYIQSLRVQTDALINDPVVQGLLKKYRIKERDKIDLLSAKIRLERLMRALSGRFEAPAEQDQQPVSPPTTFSPEAQSEQGAVPVSSTEQDEANRLAGIRLEERFNRDFEEARPKIEALFDGEGKTWVVKNGKIAKPGGIQERWTPDELKQMVARFRDAGLAASVTGSSGQSMKSTFAIIDTDSQRMFGIVMNERAAKASAEAKRESQRQEQARKQGYLADADQDALQWMNQTFGEDFTNEYNKKALSDFLTGKAAKFNGMVSQRWTDGVVALGAIADAAKGTVDFAAIKKAFDARGAPVAKDSSVTAEQDEGDAALGEAFAGLFASPTVKPLAQSDLPKDRRDAMMKAASTLIDLGLRKPEELAQRLDKLAPNGALRQYTRAFWRLMSGFDSTLEENPHWPTIYGELDQVSSRPPSVEGVIGAVPEQGAAPASGLISDEESARLDALTVNNKDRLDKLSANQLSQLNKELLRQPSSAKIDAILATEHPDDIKAALDVVTKSKADTPATAEAKVEEQVQVVAATEGQRDAKEIKKEIAEKLDAAIAAALENESPRAKELRTEIKGLEIAKKETTSAASSRNLTKQIGRLQKELDRETAVGTKSLTKGEIDGSIITIQIPGDGTFKVWNTAENLRNIRRRVSLIETDVKPDAPQRSEQDNRKQDAINLADGASERFGGPLAAIEWLKEQMSDSTDSVKEWYQSAIDILSKRKGDIAREEAEQSTPESESTSTAGVDESALNTPMMKQWRTLREPLDANTVLLVRLGDFYEAFGNDAKVLSEFAKVALTKRNGIPMAGIPHHSATSYIQKLVSAGKRVAIAEQVGDAKPGVPTEREVTSITPETKAEPATVADTEIIPPTSAQSTMMETLEAAVAKERAKTGDFNRAVYFHRLNGDPSVYVEKRNSTNQTADRDSLALARMDTEGKTSIMPRDEGRQVMAKIVEETAIRDTAENARSKANAEQYRQSEYARTYRTSPSGIIVTRNSDGEWIERGTDRKLGRKKGDDDILSALSGPNLALKEVVMEKSGNGIYWRGVNDAPIEAFTPGQRVTGKKNGDFNRAGTIDSSGPITDGERTWFVQTDTVGSVVYKESELTAEQPAPSTESREEVAPANPRIAEIDAELADLQARYEQKSKQQSKGSMVPPAIKADALRQITNKMDKLDAEKKALLAAPAVEESAPEVETPPEPVTPPVVPPAKRTKKTISKIEDVGEKIGGARKDRWKERGLAMSDYDGLTDTEKQAYTNKAQVFPKPDYQAMIDGGMDKPMAYALKEVYDSIAPKPNLTRAQQADPAQRDAALRLYVETVGKIRDGLKAVKTPEELKALRDAVFESSPTGYGGRLTYTETAKAIMHLVSTGKRRYELPGAMEVTGYDLRNIARKLEKLPAWPAPQEQWQRMFDIRRIPIGSVLSTKLPDGTWEKKTVTEDTPPVWQVTKDYRILSEHSSQEAAEAWAKAAAVKSRKEDPKRPYNPDVKRTGPDYRNGRDVAGEELLAEFGFRGAEFGLWTNDSDRQQSLNQAFDGLHDLARILNVPPKAISLNGELGIAFGARGSGKFAAHYEPSRVVINLTKTSGAGALAHEWAHALDDYFGRMATKGRSGEYVSHGAKGTEDFRAELAATINEVMKAISERQWTQPEYIADLKERNATAQKKTDSWLKSVERSTAKVELTPEQKDEVDTYMMQLRGQRMPEALVNGRPDMTQVATKMLAIIDSAAKAQKIRVDWPVTGGGKMSDLAAGLGRHSGMIFATNNDLARVEAGDIQVPTRTVPTNTLKASQEQGDYWQRKHELFARSFEAFVEDSIRREGNQSPYLVGFTADSGSWGNLYPQGDERAATNEAFQKMVDTLKSRETDKGVALFATPTAPKVSIPDLHAAFVTAKRQQGDTPRVSAVYAAAKSKNPDLTRQEFMQAVQSGQYAPLVTIQDGKMTLAPITDAEIMDAAENATETPETILEEWAATKEPLQSSPGGLSEAEVPIYENPKFLAAQEAEDTKEQNRIAAGYFRNFLDRVKSRGWQRGDTYHSAFSRAKIIKTGRSRISNSTYFTVLAEPTEQGPNAEVWADREGLSWDRDEDTGKLTVTFDVRVSDHEATDSAATHADIEFDVEKINSGDVSWLDLSDTFFPELNELVEEKYFGNPESSRADGVEEPLQASPTASRDAEYMAAVEAGDMVKAQRMVDAAAKAANYDTSLPLVHHTFRDFTVFKMGGYKQPYGGAGWSGKGVWMEPEKLYLAKKAKGKKPNIAHTHEYESKLAKEKYADTERRMKTLRLYAKILNPVGIYGASGTDFAQEQRDEHGFSRSFPLIITDKDLEILKAKQKDAAFTADENGNIEEVIVFSPEQIKSADPVTRDEAGNVIPLSQRFNPESNSILYANPSGKEGNTGKKPRRTVDPSVANPGDSKESRDAFDAIRSRYVMDDLTKANFDEIRTKVAEALDANEADILDNLLYKVENELELRLEEEVARRMLSNRLRKRGLQEGNAELVQQADILMTQNMIGRTETARKLAIGVDQFQSPQERLDSAIGHIIAPNRAHLRERLVNVWTPAAKRREIARLEAEIAQAKTDLSRAKLERTLAEAQARQDQAEVIRKVVEENNAKVDAILKRNGLTQTDLFLSVDDRFAMQEAILGLARVHLSQQSAAHKKAIEMSVRGYSDNAIAKETGLSVAEVSNTAEHFRNVVAKQAVSKEVGKGNTFSKFIQWGKRIISEMDDALRATPSGKRRNLAEDLANTRAKKRNASAQEVAEAVQSILNTAIPTKSQRNSNWLHEATWTYGKKTQKVFVPYNAADWKQVYRVARELSTREATRLDKAYEYWINGILSGPQTHVVNTASNLLSTAWAYGPQWFSEATANVAIRNPNAPQFGEFRHVWAGFFKGIMPALRNFALAWDTEADPVEHQYLDKPVTVMFQGGNLDKVGGIRPSIGGTLGRYVRVPGRFLVAQDAFAKTLIMHAESAAMAYRLGKKQGLAGAALTNFMASQIATHGSESWQHAFEKAVELTFQDENDVTKAVEGVTNALKRAKFVGGLMRYLLPFVRTPTNIYRAGIRKAGGSAGMLLYRLGKSGYYAIKGDKNEFRSYREGAMVKDVSESVMATALWFIVMGMSEGDDDDNQKAIEITGSRPFGVANAGERASQLRQEGGSNLIIIRKNPLTGEKLDKPIQFAYGRYEPIALALSTLVDGAREFKEWTRFQPENRTTDKLAGSMMRHVLAQAKEKTFLQGVSGVLQFIEDAGSNNFSGKDILMKNLMNGAIPNLIRQPYRLSQDEIADAKKAESELSRSLGIGQPKVNEAGQPVQRGGNAVTRVLFPVASKASTELFDAALKKWNATNPDQQWNPDPLTKADLYVYGPKVDGKMQQVPLKDPAKITKFEQEIGQKFSDYAGRKLMAAGWRPGKPVTPQMIDAIKEVRTNAIKSVRGSMGREERFGTTTPAAAPSTPSARPSPAPSMPVPSTPPRPVPMKDDAAERAKARLIEARKRLNYGGK